MRFLSFALWHAATAPASGIAFQVCKPAVGAHFRWPRPKNSCRPVALHLPNPAANSTAGIGSPF